MFWQRFFYSNTLILIRWKNQMRFLAIKKNYPCKYAGVSWLFTNHSKVVGVVFSEVRA